MVKDRYCVVIGTYGKPPNSFYEMANKLISKNIDVFIVYSGNDKYYIFNSKLIRIKRIENCGLGSNFNVGIELALQNGFNLFTLLTDDVTILDDFDKQDIIDYYNRNCSNKDVLSFALVSDQVPAKDAVTSPKFVVDTGMTFSDFIAKNLRFRKDFVMDQQDILFCYDLRHKLGGRIVSYNKRVIKIYPVGRGVNGGIHFIPNYRLYLLTRNSLTNFMETKDTIFIYLFVEQAIIWLFRGILGHERKVFNAFFMGVYDALKHKLGVTEILQLLSNNRFDK